MKMMVKSKFKYSLSVLNISVYIGILIVLIFTIINWEELSREEGWGVVAMFGLGIIIGIGLIIDFIFQLIFRNKRTLNIVGAFVVLIYVYFILLYL